MLWIVVLLMCCLRTVESEECKTSETIVGRLGKELVLNFPLSDLRDEYDKHIAYVYGKKNIRYANEIRIQDMKKETEIYLTHKMDYLRQILFIYGKPTSLAGSRTEIFMTNDAFVVNKTELQTEDAGMYWIYFKDMPFGRIALMIAGKPTIKGRSLPNPVLKAEDNFRTILQFECHSVSTSIGYCQLYNAMYIVWYTNGTRMTDLDPTLSQINVTVDHTGGNFTCLATDYGPCYQRLQTTKHYDALNIEECDNVHESQTFVVKPQYAPIDVKLEPDQRVITVNKNEDLKVRCSAKCHPKCDVKWEKDLQESIDLVTGTSGIFGNDLKIVNISSSDAGVYSCLVSNTHGEVKKNFTLYVRETKTNVLTFAENTVIVAIVVVIVIIVFLGVSMAIIYKKYHKEITAFHYEEPEEISSEEDDSIFEAMDLHQGAPLPATSNIYEAFDLHESPSLSERPRMITDETIYEAMALSGGPSLPERSRLLTDETMYEAMVLRGGPPLPARSRLITNGSIDESFDLRGGPPPPARSRLITNGSIDESFDLRGGPPPPARSRLITNGSIDESFDLREGPPPPARSRLITNGSIDESFDLRGGPSLPERSRLITNGSIDEAMALRGGPSLSEKSRLITDETIPMALLGGPPLPERSRLITDGRDYERIDGSYETIDGSYETIDGSYETMDGSYETMDLCQSRTQSEPLLGISRDNNNPTDEEQGKKQQNDEYDVLGVKCVPSVYTRLYQEEP